MSDIDDDEKEIADPAARARLEGIEAQIAALEAEALEVEAAARLAELTPEEQRIAAALARKAAAAEAMAAAARTRRGTALATREAAARVKAAGRYLVKGIDLVDLFQLGAAPDAAKVPGDGVVIVRSPLPERLKAFQTEAEHKARPLADIFADLLCDSVIDPDPSQPANGAKLRAFCDAYPGAAIGAGDVVAKLGGSKAQADKRGRS